MTLDAFGRLRPFTIGFDRVFKDLEKLQNVSETYPPYNLIKSSDDIFFIELAVAGFNKNDLEIEYKNSILTIKGKTSKKEEVNYIHKGISERSFTRVFTLAEHIKVKTAEVTNGLLVISLERDIPEEEKPIAIKIK
jgi:molecular chaperone IbpA